MQILMFCVVVAAGIKPPNVYILIQDAEPSSGNTHLPSNHWSVPGNIPNLAGLLYGKTPLECGVVSDFDWRRKPIPLHSLADSYKAAGYHTSFFGEWGMGMQPPFDPASRGFDTYWGNSDSQRRTLDEVIFTQEKSKESVLETMPEEKPWLCVIRQGASKMKPTQLIEELSKSKAQNAAVMVTLTHESSTATPMGGYQGLLPEMNSRAIWECYPSLVRFIGGEADDNPPHLIYHRGQWPLTDSPEKHRHRGSEILSEKWALLDGLKLYPVVGGLVVSKDQSLDLAEHVQEHQELLTIHTKWWLRAGKAINNSRPFDVGGADYEPTQLTALDWRPSLILHKDGSGIASEPMVYEDKLLAILRGLRDHPDYKESFPAYSGSWSVNLLRPGRFKISARLLPDSGLHDEDGALAKLQGGLAYARLGGNEVQLRIQKGATSVSVLVDADAGVMDLECWFTGQLSLERELGAFFVEIQRVADKKFDFKAQPKVPSETP